MELESLKYIWHRLEMPPVNETDRKAMRDLLERESRGPVTRMRRNLIGEGILMLVTYIPVVLLYMLAFEGRLAVVSWLFVLVGAFFIGYFYRTWRVLGWMQCPASQVRSNLDRQLKSLKKYIRFYLLAGAGMIPLTILLSYGIVCWKFPSAAGAAGIGGGSLFHRLDPVPWFASPLFWLILLAPLTIGAYYINACYINRLYGRHIKKLQDLVEEMGAE